MKNIINYCLENNINYLDTAASYGNSEKTLGKTIKNVPKYISMSQITDEVLATVEEEAKNELKSEGKPEKIWDRIIPGKIERFISDNTTLDQEQCLLDQNFIKDEKKSVDDYVKSYGDVKVTGFNRVSLG